MYPNIYVTSFENTEEHLYCLSIVKPIQKYTRRYNRESTHREALRPNYLTYFRRLYVTSFENTEEHLYCLPIVKPIQKYTRRSNRESTHR